MARTVVKTYTVEPTSRLNVQVNTLVPELANESFGAVIEVTSGPGIFVERALYSDRNGVRVRGRHERAGDAPAVIRQCRNPADARGATRVG